MRCEHSLSCGALATRSVTHHELSPNLLPRVPRGCSHIEDVPALIRITRDAVEKTDPIRSRRHAVRVRPSSHHVLRHGAQFGEAFLQNVRWRCCERERERERARVGETGGERVEV